MSWNKTHSKSIEEKVKRLKEANSELRKQIKLLQSNSCLKDKDEKLQQLDDAYASVMSDFESAVMEIESLKKIINTSIEEIEYAIIKPQYADVYLNNAIRFLKETK